jgi:hypothetical protein
MRERRPVADCEIAAAIEPGTTIEGTMVTMGAS